MTRLSGTAVAALMAMLAGCQPAAEGSPSASASVRASATAEVTSAASAQPAAPSATPEPLAWTELDAAGPAAREDHTWTLAGHGRTAYLFGGRDGGTVFGDLWSFDLETDTWAELAADGPPARFGHESVWVDGVGLVIFAGQSGATFFDDLWAFDPAEGVWHQLPSAGESPVARYGTCAAVGPDGRLWISHGFTADGTRFSDTRAYDFASGTWSDETPDGERPVDRCLHGCWWTDDGSLTLYAGQTTGVTALGDRWSLGDAGWTELSGTAPPERNLYARTRLDGATLVFGGQALDGSFLDDLWLMPDSTADAIALEAGGGPARAGAEMVHDATADRVLLFGGRDGDGAHADLWQLRGNLEGQPSS
ncbi:MAG TPA: kelch repeat-containing protein [Candidatus Limnocylindria bacterium]|nr:kelch repeat-containing protein [Candidatus Limnocylindria bacterium]